MELVDIYDDNDNFTGIILDRDEAHKKGLLHHHAFAWIINNEGKILMQKRALTKLNFPGIWARTGGHVLSGETCEDGIKREALEEIGLNKIDKIIEVNKYKNENFKDNGFTYEYIIFTDMKEEDFKLDKEEVEEVKYFNSKDLIEAKKINDTNFSICRWSDEYFNFQMNILKKYL